MKIKNFFVCLSALLLVLTGCKKEVESVTVMPESISLKVGKTYQLSAVVKPDKAPQEVRWMSSDLEVATVSANGLVTAVSEGKCEISVYADLIKSVCKVRVWAEGSDPGDDPGDDPGSDTTQIKKDSVLTFALRRKSGDTIRFTMVWVEGGSFIMGSNSSASNFDKPEHKVTLSSYYIGETEVTQALWEAVMNMYEPDSGWSNNIGRGDKYPAYNVRWTECRDFVTQLNQWLSKQLNSLGLRFALPTEAQWEYAARGGKYSHGYDYAGSNDAGEVSWYKSNSGGHMHTVGSKAPNELGLYDMCGNVCEWCSDWFDFYTSEAQKDPEGPGMSANNYPNCKIYRGGDISENCWNVFTRGGGNADYGILVNNRMGFRLVLVRN